MANHCMIRFQLQNLHFDADEMVLEAVIRDNLNMDNETTIEAVAQSMPTKLGVMDFLQPRVRLSGGQRKRLALVSVLLLTTAIMILDVNCSTLLRYV